MRGMAHNMRRVPISPTGTPSGLVPKEPLCSSEDSEEVHCGESERTERQESYVDTMRVSKEKKRVAKGLGFPRNRGGGRARGGASQDGVVVRHLIL